MRLNDLELLTEAPPQAAATPQRGLSMGTLVLIVGIISVAVVFGLQLANRGQTQPQRGQFAPDFELVTYDGQTLRLSDLRGQIVVVNFWGSWCLACYDEAPSLQAIWEEYGDKGVLLVGVAWLDPDSKSLAFIEQFGLTYPNGPDTGERIARRYNITGAPENFVIGPDGRVEEAILGPVTYEQLRLILERLLAERDA